MWDPTIYLRYANERGRPFVDLVSRIGAEDPAVVVDLGCGPGTLTTTLAERWPGARIIGLDSSAEMIMQAKALDTNVVFELDDLRDYTPDPDVDVLMSNAALQWVDGHANLIDRWARELRPGAWLAFQLPANFQAPSHQLIYELADDPRWRDRLALRDRASVHETASYADLLLRAGANPVDCWETVYQHVLPVAGGVHPVVSWLEGTALRPVRAALSDDDYAAFVAALTPGIARAYPVINGRVLFGYRRIFVVSRTGTTTP